MAVRVVLVLVSMCWQGTANAAWLALCKEPTRDGGVATRSLSLGQTDGAVLHLALRARAADGCRQVEIPVPLDEVLWLGMLRPKGKGDIVSVVLQGNENETSSGMPATVSEFDLRLEGQEAEDAPPNPLPPNIELLDEMQASAFGGEGRARFERAPDGIVLECTAGKQPAGLRLKLARSRLPLGVQLDIVLRYTASDGFDLGVLDAQRLQQESPLILGRLAGGKQPVTAVLAVPDVGLQRHSPVEWSLHCPATAAQLHLTALRLEAHARASRSDRAQWVWRPQAWQENAGKLLQRARELQVDTVFISVPVVAGAVLHPERLSQFIARAGQQRVTVWAVEGDPHAVMPEGRRQFVRRAQALSVYNQSVPPAQRLAGIQYDVEPYLLPGYALNPDSWHQAYVHMMSEVHAAAGMPLDAVLPFWWAEAGTGEMRLLDALAPMVARVTVMNYRTDRAELLRFAEPFLIWGERAGRPVRLALEAGPLPVETRWHFTPAKQGHLWSIRLGDQVAVMLMRNAARNPQGRQFSLQHRQQTDPGRTTFHGDTKTMHAMVPELETIWSAWPAFDGIALHGLDEGL